MVTKTLVNLKKICFYKFEYTAKKREGVGGAGAVAREWFWILGGVWHKNDLDVKYTPLCPSAWRTGGFLAKGWPNMAYFSQKPSASQGESSLKISYQKSLAFGEVREQTNK